MNGFGHPFGGEEGEEGGRNDKGLPNVGQRERRRREGDNIMETVEGGLEYALNKNEHKILERREGMK
jgi:hypothetical protein